MEYLILFSKKASIEEVNYTKSIMVIKSGILFLLFKKPLFEEVNVTTSDKL